MPGFQKANYLNYARGSIFMRIKKGFAFVYYCIDVADSINTDNIRSVLGKKGQSCVLSASKISPEYIQYKRAPVFFKLGFCSIKSHPKISVDAKVYDFGVVTLRLSVPVSGSFDDLRKISRELVYGGLLDSTAMRYLRKIKKEIETLLVKQRSEPEPFETFCIFHVSEFDKTTNVDTLMKNHRVDIAKLLKPDAELLSKNELDSAVSHYLSYYTDEIVIIDWNASFIYDPRISFDVVDIIEFALISLLELRYYDDVLDIAIDKAYIDIEAKKNKFSLSPYGKTLDSLQRVKLEVSEVIDKMSNSLKLIGEQYLAKVYAQASKVFYLDTWKASVKEKLEAISSTYDMLSHRETNREMVILETAIVALFIIDIVFLYFGL
jgi:hypothetical protein